MTTTETSRVVTLTAASTIRIERQQELWRGQIMLGVPHLMAGMGGVGKSTATCHIAAQITKGTLEGDLYGMPASVMVINTEDSPAMVKARMMAAGADLDRVFIVSTRFCDENGELTETTPKLRQDVDQLEQLMLQHDVRLLVADPLATVIEGDTNTGSDVRATIDPMIRLAHNTGATVLIVSHFNKGTGSASNKISGSHAIRDAVRGAHVFAKDEDEGVTVMTLDKNNYSQEVGKSQAFRLETRTVNTDDGETMEVPIVVMLGETNTTVTDLINRQSGGDEQAEDRNAAQAFIFDYLMRQPDGEGSAGEILKAGRAAGFSDNELKHARARAKNPRVESRKASFGTGWVWGLGTEGATQGAEGASPQEGGTLGTFVAPSVAPLAPVTPIRPEAKTSKPVTKKAQAVTNEASEADTPLELFSDLEGNN